MSWLVSERDTQRVYAYLYYLINHRVKCNNNPAWKCLCKTKHEDSNSKLHEGICSL